MYHTRFLPWVKFLPILQIIWNLMILQMTQLRFFSLLLLMLFLCLNFCSSGKLHGDTLYEVFREYTQQRGKQFQINPLPFTLPSLPEQTKSFGPINLISDNCLLCHSIFADVTFGAATANMCLSQTAIGLSKLIFLGKEEKIMNIKWQGKMGLLSLVFLTVICQ